MIGDIFIKIGKALGGTLSEQKRICGSKFFPAWHLIPMCPLRDSYSHWIKKLKDSDIKLLRTHNIYLNKRLWSYGLPSAQNLERMCKVLGLDKEYFGWEIFDEAEKQMGYPFCGINSCPQEVKESVIARGVNPDRFAKKANQYRVYRYASSRRAIRVRKGL